MECETNDSKVGLILITINFHRENSIHQQKFTQGSKSIKVDPPLCMCASTVDCYFIRMRPS